MAKIKKIEKILIYLEGDEARNLLEILSYFSDNVDYDRETEFWASQLETKLREAIDG